MKGEGLLDTVWLAGFIDGEGHVGAHPLKEVRGRTYHQTVCFIRNTHEPTMKHVKHLLDYLLGTDLRMAHETRARGKDSYGITVSHMRALNTLGNLVLPYSVTKHEQWELMLEYTESRLALSGHKRPYSERDLQLLERLTTMNKRWTEGVK